MAGRPTLPRAASPSSCEATIVERAHSMPIFRIASRKSSRSSALRITSDRAPRSSMSREARYPLSARERATFSATWPPMVGRTAYDSPGCSRSSFSMTARTEGGVTGSI